MMAFETIDCALANYYASCGDNTYYNEDGIGKFMEFVTANGFDD